MIENFSKEELTNEQWRDVDGYDGVYQVSDLGRVRSKKYGKTRVLRPYKDGNGYFTVDLHQNRQRKSARVHRLVAHAFIENTDSSKTIINHINEDKTDNRASNLEWCTIQYNVTYNDIHLRRINCKRIKIKDMYDPNLTYKQNLEIFRTNGIDCSDDVIKCLRRDLGISKHYSPREPVRYKIRDLFNPELSINENLELFKSNGIYCSRTSLYRLRKELGLVNQK